MGSAIGAFAGLKVVRFNHTHEGNRIDWWFLGAKSTASSIRVVADGSEFGVVVHLAR